jgi:hypothetical protein
MARPWLLLGTGPVIHFNKNAYITAQLNPNQDKGRAMAQAVSRRPSTAESRVRSRVSPCGVCGGQSGTGTGFSPSTLVFPCQFHSTGAPLLVKLSKKLLIFITGFVQKALRLWCVRSICCGALQHEKKTKTNNWGKKRCYIQQNALSCDRTAVRQRLQRSYKLDNHRPLSRNSFILTREWGYSYFPLTLTHHLFPSV